ncbi:MAG: hypothetical protein ACM37Z_07145, partial [Deltaproteobacteria bacterium]
LYSEIVSWNPRLFVAVTLQGGEEPTVHRSTDSGRAAQRVASIVHVPFMLSLSKHSEAFLQSG